MNTFLWFVAWVALWAFLVWIVAPWWVRRAFRAAMRKVLPGVQSFAPHLPPPAFRQKMTDFERREQERRARGLQYDPTDPGMNRGYVPGDDPEES